LTNLGPGYVPASSPFDKVGEESLMDKWIKSKLSEATKQANEGLNSFDLSLATTAIYDFWLHQLCDVYLESIKPVMFLDQTVPQNVARKAAAQHTLYTCFDFGLRLIHPFMPFISEELYHRIPHPPSHPPSIMIAQYPTFVPEWFVPEIEEEVKSALSVVHGIRSLKSNFGILGKLPGIVRTNSSHIQLLEKYLGVLITLSGLSECTFLDSETQPIPTGCLVQVVDDKCQAYLVQKDKGPDPAEIQKLNKKLSTLQQQADALSKRMASQQKAPEEVKQSNQARLEALNKEIASCEEALQALKQ